MELILNHRPIPRTKEMGMQNIQRKDRKSKGLNSLSPADSYKLNNEESNCLSGEKVSEEFNGVYSNGNPSQGKPGVGKTCSLLTFSFILLLQYYKMPVRGKTLYFHTWKRFSTPYPE